MRAAWEWLERLSQHPHRGSATPEEAEAAADLQQWLASMGYSVQKQPFRSPRDTLYLGPPVTMLGCLFGVAVGVWAPWMGLLVCCLSIAPLIGELLGSRVNYDWLLPKYSSQNLIARPSGLSNAKLTVVVSAHYDTQRASPLFHPAFVKWLQPYFVFVYASLFAIPLGLGLHWAIPSGIWVTWILAAGCLLTTANMLFLLVCRLTGGYTNGANDNGSGVALLLALAERWAGQPPTEAEPLFLLTGSEEVGIRGMKHFIRHCGLDRERTLCINLDNLGAGTLHYLTGEGMLAYKHYNPLLVAEAGQMASSYPHPVRPRRNLPLPTDGVAAAAAGYSAITFIASTETGALPNYHWYTDRLDRIDRSTLTFTEQFLWEYLQRVLYGPVGQSIMRATPGNSV